jgi:hypothetical protein
MVYSDGRVDAHSDEGKMMMDKFIQCSLGGGLHLFVQTNYMVESVDMNPNKCIYIPSVSSFS